MLCLNFTEGLKNILCTNLNSFISNTINVTKFVHLLASMDILGMGFCKAIHTFYIRNHTLVGHTKTAK